MIGAQFFKPNNFISLRDVIFLKILYPRTAIFCQENLWSFCSESSLNFISPK